MENLDEYLNVLLNIGIQISQLNQSSGVLNNQKVKWRVVQGITTIMELRMESVLSKFDQIQDLMYGALMHKEQEVALAASEFWSGINSTKME